MLTSANPKEVAAALKLRNQLARLLMDRIRAVRSAAAYVFRSHPAVVRSFASACERRRRSASRRRAAAEAAAKAALEEAMKGAEAKAKGTS